MKDRYQETSTATEEELSLDQLIAWAASQEESLGVILQPENDAENINSELFDTSIIVNSEDEEKVEQSASKRRKILPVSYENAFPVESNSTVTSLFPTANRYSQSLVDPNSALNKPSNRTLPDMQNPNFDYALCSISDIQELIRSNPQIFNLAKKLKVPPKELMKTLSKFSYLDKNNHLRTLTYEKLRKWNDAETKQKLGDSYHIQIGKKQKILIKNRLFLDVFNIIKKANKKSDAAAMLGVSSTTLKQSLAKIKYKDKNNCIILLCYKILKGSDWNEEFARRIFGTAFDQPMKELFDITFNYPMEPLNNSEIDPLQFLYPAPTSYIPLHPIQPVPDIGSNAPKQRSSSCSFAHNSLRTIHQMLIILKFSMDELARELNQLSGTHLRYTLQRYLSNYEYIDENGETCILNLFALKNWDEKKASEKLGQAYDKALHTQLKIEVKDRRLKDIIKITSFNSKTNAISMLGITHIELLENALSKIKYVDKNGRTAPLSYTVLTEDRGYLIEIFGEAVNLPLKKLFNETFPSVQEKANDPADPLQFLNQVETNYIPTSFLAIDESVPTTPPPTFSNSGQGFFTPADLTDQTENTPPQNLTHTDAKLTPQN